MLNTTVITITRIEKQTVDNESLYFVIIILLFAVLFVVLFNARHHIDVNTRVSQIEGMMLLFIRARVLDEQTNLLEHDNIIEIAESE